MHFLAIVNPNALLSAIVKRVLVSFQFLDDKQWINDNFPRDMRYENVMLYSDNVLKASYMQYVSSI